MLDLVFLLHYSVVLISLRYGVYEKIKKRIRKKVIPSIRQKIVSLYENGNTYKIIAAATDVTTGTVGSILKQAGVVRRQTIQLQVFLYQILIQIALRPMGKDIGT